MSGDLVIVPYSHTLVNEYRQLSIAERQAVREAILDDPGE